MRYYAQIILQSCAIKSQLQDHDGALYAAYDGLTSCIKVFKKSLDLCESEILDKMNKDSTSVNTNHEYQNTNTTVLSNQMEMESVNSEYGVVLNKRKTAIGHQN